MWLWLWGEKSNSSVGFLSLWNTKEEDRFSQSTQSAEGSLNVDDWSAVLPSVCCQVCLKKSFFNWGPSRSRPARSLLFFKLPLFFCPKWSHFSLSERPPKLNKLRIHVTPAKKFHNLLLSSISTTRWPYNQGKCVLAYNSQVACSILMLRHKTINSF